MRLNSVQNLLSEIEYSTAELSMISHVFACNFRGGSELTELSQGCVDRTSPWPGHRDCSFISEFGYLAAFSNVGGSKLSDILNDAKFSTFLTPVKLGKGWARLLQLYLRQTSTQLNQF